jgi:hypothetical protein
MVREKRMILQMDCASMLNKKDIKNTVEILVKEGRIKRQKVKNRGKVGNLTDVWLLYRNDVKQEEILEFEKELINKPFVSPLVKNHCYKKVESPVEAEIKEHLVSNVIDMQEYVKVNNQDVIIKEFQNQRVVTFDEIDQVHERPSGTARRNFNTNKNRFIEGVDYFLFKGEKGREALLQANYTKFVELPKSKNFAYYLITETGYMMLVKSFTDDLSWTVQRELVNSYFKIKELKEKQKNNLPITQQDFSSVNTYDILKVFASGITDLNDRVKSLESTIDQFKKALNE